MGLRVILARGKDRLGLGPIWCPVWYCDVCKGALVNRPAAMVWAHTDDWIIGSDAVATATVCKGNCHRAWEAWQKAQGRHVGWENLDSQMELLSRNMEWPDFAKATSPD